MSELTDITESCERLFESMKERILTFPSHCEVSGCVYYVSNSGDDANDGKSPVSPWKSTERVSNAELKSGDAVLFRCGHTFRGGIAARAGVTYSSYGEGEKPKLYGSELSLAEPSLWEQYDSEHHIWRCRKKLLDAGTLVFNEGEAHSVKLIPSYKNGGFVCRDDESREFHILNEMHRDLDMYWHFDGALTEEPSNGESFPVPDVENAYGELYLRCDGGNPGELFTSIEALSRTHMFAVGDKPNVTVDNLCIKYVGMHGVAAGGHCVGLHVKNCEIGWVGGCIQHYLGTDPNYPDGARGTVTRFGNGVEIYGGCEDYAVENNWIYQVYDAAITHQITTEAKVRMTGIRYTGNVIEHCVYGIEYFLDILNGENESYMENVLIDGNFIRLSGYGWGRQRHNKQTPAHIKGWSFENTAYNFRICNNIFDRCSRRMLHLVAQKDSFCPLLSGNTYIQYEGNMLGQYGGKEAGEPIIYSFDGNAETTVKNIFKDTFAKVYILPSRGEILP